MIISRRLICSLAVATLGALGTAARAESSAPGPAAPNPQVRVTTSMGSFVIELLPDRAPITVGVFLKYVAAGQYTQTLIHRVIPGFLIQGGGFSATDEAAKPATTAVANESGNGLQNKRGFVGLARTEAPHSGNCQFFVNMADNPELDPLPVRWGYAVFGRVIDGMDVVDHISTVPTGPEGRFKSDSPLTHVIIEKVEVITGGAKPNTPLQLAPPPNGTEVQSPN
jgi:peptidyl-prolyl cis-trans isomerase A (cyclophilin A)